MKSAVCLSVSKDRRPQPSAERYTLCPATRLRAHPAGPPWFTVGVTLFIAVVNQSDSASLLNGSVPFSLFLNVWLLSWSKVMRRFDVPHLGPWMILCCTGRRGKHFGEVVLCRMWVTLFWLAHRTTALCVPAFAVYYFDAPKHHNLQCSYNKLYTCFHLLQ